MKKIFVVLLATILVSFCVSGCTDTNTGEPEDQGQKVEAPQPDREHGEVREAGGFRLEGNAEQVVADLNRYLDSLGMNEDYDHFDDSYTCQDFEELTLYRSTLGMGWNVIVAYHKNTGQYQLVDLEDWGAYRILSIGTMAHDPDILRFYMECDRFGGDYYFKNFPAEVYYSLEAGQVIESYSDFESGTYGIIAGRDYQVIDSLQIADDRAVFTFALTEGGDGNGYDGAELLVMTPLRYEYENPTTIGFWYTENSLDADALEQLRQMEGVADVQVESMEHALFTGTVLTVTPEPHYQVDCFFADQSERTNELTLRCRRIKYPEPDFTKELGFALELPANVELREPADVYYNRRMEMPLTVSDGTEMKFRASRSPVDSLSVLDHVDADALESMSLETDAGPVSLITSNGREWTAQWEAHWHLEDWHFSLVTYREGLSREAWSELVSDFIDNCEVIAAR